MLRIVFILLITFVHANVKAEWVEAGMGKEDSTSYTFYVDISSLKKSGNLIKIWVMNDYKTAIFVDGKNISSSKMQDEFDCKEELGRTLYYSAYSENMGKGEVIDQKRLTEMMEPAPPDSIKGFIFRIACKKKSSLGELPLQEREREMWEEVQKNNNIDSYQVYLSSYPKGKYAVLARKKIKKIESLNGKDKWENIGKDTPIIADFPKSGTSFHDCPDCPEMIVIPAGDFYMGSNNVYPPHESPAHEVKFKFPFAIGKTEITQGQWKALMGNNPSSFVACGDDCPVDNISWIEAKFFVQKLSQTTGKEYRMPSEAEWEYAAASGTYSYYTFADEFAWYRENATKQVMKRVGLGEPNQYGLYDMFGNVWEWTEDCRNDDYNGAPNNGDAWKSGDCSNHVMRGGTKLSENVINAKHYSGFSGKEGKEECIRCDNRIFAEANNKNYLNGLRVVRILP